MPKSFQVINYNWEWYITIDITLSDYWLFRSVFLAAILQPPFYNPKYPK